MVYYPDWFDCNPIIVTIEQKTLSILSILSDSLQSHGLYSPWNSLGQNTGVGSLSLLQGFFPTQGSNPGLLRCRQILDHLSHQGHIDLLFSRRSQKEV